MKREQKKYNRKKSCNPSLFYSGKNFIYLNVFLSITSPENTCESQLKSFQNRTHNKGYKCAYYKCWVKDMVLEGKQCQSHVGEDEILCQEIEKLKQLKQNFKRLVQ